MITFTKAFKVGCVLLSFIFLTCNGLTCPNVTQTVQVPFLDEILYSYDVKVTAKGQNSSHQLFEFFDNSSQSLYRYGDIVNKDDYKHMAWTYNYNLMQQFSVEGDRDNKVCSVNDLKSSSDHKSIFHDDFNISEPGNSTFNFLWNKAYNATLTAGVNLGDGTIADKYETCLLSDEGDKMYLVEVYFTAKPENSTFNSPAIPLHLILNATVAVGNTSSTTSLTKYEITNYRNSKHKRSWSPLPPHDVVCDGRKDDPNITLPLTESKLHINAQEGSQNASISSNMFFDFKNGLFRVDINDNLFYVVDYNQGLQFKRSKDTCSISSLSSSPSPFKEVIADDAFLVSDGIPELSTNNAYKYGGHSRFLGSSAYSYISTNPKSTRRPGSNSSELVYNTLYVSSDDSSLLGLRHRLVSNNKTSETWVRFSKFSQRVSMDDFDVSKCFQTKPSRDLTMKFSIENLSTIQENFSTFKESFLSKISQLANVTRLRLSSVVRTHVTDDGDDSEADVKLFVTFTLLKLYQFNDTVSEVAQSNSTEAVEKLKRAIDGNQFTVMLLNNNKTMVNITALDNFLIDQNQLLTDEGHGSIPTPTPSPPTPPPTPSNGVSVIVVLVISFATFLIGVAIGLLLAAWKQKQNLTFNYSAFDTA